MLTRTTHKAARGVFAPYTPTGGAGPTPCAAVRGVLNFIWISPPVLRKKLAFLAGPWRENGVLSFFSKKIDVFGARPPEKIKAVLRPIGRSPQIGRAAENFDNFVPQKAIFKS